MDLEDAGLILQNGENSSHNCVGTALDFIFVAAQVPGGRLLLRIVREVESVLTSAVVMVEGKHPLYYIHSISPSPSTVLAATQLPFPW